MTMAKSSTERQRALIVKREKAGLKRFLIWANVEDWPQIKRFVERLVKRRNAK